MSPLALQAHAGLPETLPDNTWALLNGHYSFSFKLSFNLSRAKNQITIENMLLVTVISNSQLLRAYYFAGTILNHFPSFRLTFAVTLTEEYYCHLQFVARESCSQGDSKPGLTPLIALP